MTYVDGFVVAIPHDRVEDYKALARRSGEVWRDHGALSYVECIEDDIRDGEVTDFRRAVQAGKGDLVGFAWVTYASRADRDRIMPKVMADPTAADRHEQGAVQRQDHDLRRVRDDPGSLTAG